MTPKLKETIDLLINGGDIDIYVLVCKTDRPEAYIPETGLTNTAGMPIGRDVIIKDIRDGQYEGLIAVYRTNPGTSVCQDVSEEIARELLDLWEKNGCEGEPDPFAVLHCEDDAALRNRIADKNAEWDAEHIRLESSPSIFR